MHSLFLEHKIDTINTNQIPVQAAHTGALGPAHLLGCVWPVSGYPEHLRQKDFSRVFVSSL